MTARPARREDPILAAAARLAAALPRPNALIGGLALAAHGYARTTEDIDFVCAASETEIRDQLRGAAIDSHVTHGDVFEGDLRFVVNGRVDGFVFDVLAPPTRMDWPRVVDVELSPGRFIPVASVEDLVRLKLRAGGPQDLLDVVQLVRRYPDQREAALRLSESYGVRGQLEAWLADRRVRAPRQGASDPRPSRGKRKGRR